MLGNKNFKKLLREFKKLDFSNEDYAIFGSGPIAARKIKDVNDLDVIIKENLWKELIKKYKPVKIGNSDCIKIGNIEIFKNWKPWFNDINELIDTAETINSIKFVRLENVLKWKHAFNRDKDKKDVILIKDYIKKQK